MDHAAIDVQHGDLVGRIAASQSDGGQDREDGERPHTWTMNRSHWFSPRIPHDLGSWTRLLAVERRVPSARRSQSEAGDLGVFRESRTPRQGTMWWGSGGEATAQPSCHAV